MPPRKQLKNFIGRLEEKARRALGSEDSPTQSTIASSLAKAQNVQSTANPALDPPAAPVVSGFVSEPVSVPPVGGTTRPGQTWACLVTFLQVLDKCSGAFGPLKLVMDGLVQFVDIHEDAAAAQRDYKELKSQLEALFSDLSVHFSGNVPPTMTSSMDNLCVAIEREIDLISSKEGGRRHLGAEKELGDVMKCYRRIHGHLQRLTINADLNIWKVVDEQATEARLKSLMPSMSACYNSAESYLVRRRECTPHTREQVLAELSHWRHDRNQGNMYWLNGMAGTGKTTIANSLCATLDRAHELGASFFCSRLLPECRNVKLIVPTIAYQLARFSRPFRCALSRVLERDPDVQTRVLSDQLDNLIISPLREVAHTLPTDLVVVIDALDECEDSIGVEQILEMLARHASGLPIKIFVSSRPEPQIREKIGSTKSQLILHELDKSIVKGDIETYLRAELVCLSLSESQLAALVERAGVLFIYAATAVRYIGENNFSLNPKRRLENVLGASTVYVSNKNQEIDKLYALILASALDNPQLEEPDKDEMKLVLQAVICAQEPLTVDAIAGLLQLNDPDLVYSALRPLWSVLHISGANKLVTTLHASFPDYMLDSERSKGYCCDGETHHGRLAELCFERIKRNERQFNICELESSYLFDEQVPQLDERVSKAIPQDLMYACQYWAAHLQLGACSSRGMQLLCEFLSARLLLWMEVLNLSKRINIGAMLLEQAREWCTEGHSPQGLIDLVHDAWRFVTMYATNPVCRSTPHIYVSMIAFWPQSRLLAEFYFSRTRGLVEVEGTGIAGRQLALLSAFTVHGGIGSMALSPDGMCIVSGCRDGTIQAWNTRNGHITLGPLRGHTKIVTSVAVSPNSMCIISASADSTICIWAAQNGQMIVAPLKGHTASVNSVAFAPHGTHIVSGSDDKTICVWETQNGQALLGPLEGHTGAVNSVAFSPDGMRIASGSRDATIRMWDAQNGQMIVAPLRGHIASVHSVAFAPDGTRIVSGSSDKTIRVWDTRNGQMVLGPLEGHTGPVPSVAFSPNGMRIVSGSFDSTVCVWDAQSGQLVQGPLKGHTNTVISVAFTPNGMRIISSSYDHTIRMWDAQDERTMLGVPEGHASMVSSVAFSPDGMHIVSGALDSTICVWDVQTGEMILGPLNGHVGTVSLVAFSNDGMHIISGSYDLAIRMWAAYIEEEGTRQDSHEGQDDTVSSVSSSDDDTSAILNTYTFMICEWDMQKGQGWKDILHGHTSMVNSIAFSPDGRRIAAGFRDHTICVWDGPRKIILGPLEGHTNKISSIAFSPDSMRIAAGSSDGTICIWDAQNGQMVPRSLEGHTGMVRSVAFSPDGLRVISGSSDYTICVWDALNGRKVLEPIEGHTGIVKSVAFSPDGMRIVSGSSDCTICIWDALDGDMILDPLEGHVFWVNSVAFSPDGTRIVSGSSDKVVRVWDVQNGVTSNSAPCFPNALPPSIQVSPANSTQSLLKTPTGDVASSWAMDEDGWVFDEYERLYIWVPPDLRACLLVPGNVSLMSTQGSVRLNFDDANLGESWVECYSPV